VTLISYLKNNNIRKKIHHVDSLLFTRDSGTEGETKAINYITNQMINENIKFEVESFKWSKTISFLMKLLFIFVISSAILYETIIFLKLAWLGIILNSLVIFLFYLILKNLSDLKFIILLGKRRKSRNVTVKIPAINTIKNKRLIIFSAHYDSVSEKYPYKLKRNFYMVVSAFIFPYIISTLILLIWALLINHSFLIADDLYMMYMERSIFLSEILLILYIISIIILIFNREPSRSFGSIDNASGVSVLIELTKLLNKNPLEKTDVLFLWCGAEEHGLWGSKQFCAKYFKELNQEYDLDRSYNINVDMVGTYIGLVDRTGIFKKNKMNDKIVNILEATAKSLNITLKKYDSTIEPRSDHMSFRSFAKKVKKNLQVCTFMSNKDMTYIHTSRDTPNKCSYENLNGCLDICYNAIRSIDSKVE